MPKKKRWKFEISFNFDTGLSGYKDASASISGRAFCALKVWIWRSSRATRSWNENQGRVHASAATVAVLPEAEEVDIKIEEKDLRIDVFRSNGPGGQSVNTTDSAVNHAHSNWCCGVNARWKSQIKNREKAMKVLRSKFMTPSAKDSTKSAPPAEKIKLEVATDLSASELTISTKSRHRSSHQLN